MGRVRRSCILSCLVSLAACSDDTGASSTAGTEAGSTTESTTAETGSTTDVDTDTDTGGAPIPEGAAWITLDLDAAIAQVDPRFLSYTLDTDKVVYFDFDFERPRLRNLAAALSPAMLRIGGTKADRVYYDLSDAPVDEAPPPYTRVLNRAVWDPACAFARDLDVEMLFTVNAGPGPRDQANLWTDAQARELLEYSVAQACPVSVWELGNEIGGFPLEHGFTLYGADYAVDFAVFDALVDEVAPGARTAGPASAYWPIEGEVLVPVTEDFVEAAGDIVDIVTWHYYPQQSTSCPVGSQVIDEPIPPLHWLDVVDVWAQDVEDDRDAFAPGAAVWLGETGHAQCGGEDGISNTFASSFWWLDQLGRIAARGQPMVFRQALAGGAYELIEDLDLEVKPDFLASVLWKRHMGSTVLAADVDGPSTIHAYAHCDVASPGDVALVIINYDQDAEQAVVIGDAQTGFEASVVTAAEVTATQIQVNGVDWDANEDGTVPVAAAVDGVGVLTLPPTSYAFVRVPDAGAAACAG